MGRFLRQCGKVGHGHLSWQLGLPVIGAAGSKLDDSGPEITSLGMRRDPPRQRRGPDRLEGVHPAAAVLQAHLRCLGRGDGGRRGALRRRRAGRLPRGSPLQRPRGLPLARRSRDPGQRRRRALARHARDRAREPRHALSRVRRRRLGQPGDAHRRDPQGPHGGAFRGVAREQGGQHGRPRRRLRVPDRQVRRRHQAQEGGRVLHAPQRRPDDGGAARPEGRRDHLRPGVRHGRHAARRHRARAARGRRRAHVLREDLTARRRTSPPRPSRA